MTNFRFLHAADLHLDSPLLGLSAKSPEIAEAVELASRRAFDNLIRLALDEDCRFVLLAGDVFDGDLRDFRTGRYFLSGLSHLGDAGVQVFLILGNHDAENRFAAKLELAKNVHLFRGDKAHSVAIEELGVVVHGQSFGQRDLSENLALSYPPPTADRFNIGLLHTACAGREGPHARYAPCTLEQLVNHGYQYWALGHVHGRAVLSEDPHVVYPGNLQGRHARETGPKGATIVEVADHRIVDCRHRDLDEVRWLFEIVDVSTAVDRGQVLLAVQQQLSAACAEAGSRPIALRLQLVGASPLHHDFVLRPAELREDVEALLATLPGEVWLETLTAATSKPLAPPALDPTISGQLEAEVRRLSAGQNAEALLEACLTEIQVKMPASARQAELFSRLRETARARATELALSLIAETEAPRAAG